MPDIINSNFDPRLPFPLDVRQQVQNMNALFMIPATSRWEGMVVYVRSAELPYILRGGTDNTFWQPFEFNGGGGLLPNGIVVYGEAQQSGNDVLLNDGWVWRINQVDYQSSDDTIPITPAAAGNLRVDIIVGNASSEFVKVVGTEVAGPGPAVEPNIPADTVPLVRVDVNDTGIVAIEDFVLSAFVRYDINDQNLNPAHRQNARTNIQAVSKDTDDTRIGQLTNEGKVTVDLDEASSALAILDIKQQGVSKHVFTGDEARIFPHLLRVNSPISPTARGASFRGSTNGGDPIFQIQNLAGTNIFYPRGTGGIGQLRSNASDESIRRDENYLTFPGTVSGTGKLNDVALADGVGMVKFAATVTEVSGIVSNNSDQKELLVWTDNTDGITLTEQDTDSVAANRFLREINVPYRTPVRIVYESSTGRWVNGNTGELQETDARYFEVVDDVLTLKYILPDIAALQAFVRGPAVLAYVSDPLRGGNFNYVAEADFVGSPDFGISFPAQDGGYWVRDFDGYVNIRWYEDTTAGISAGLNHSDDVDIYFPPHTYNITTTVNISKNNLNIILSEGAKIVHNVNDETCWDVTGSNNTINGGVFDSGGAFNSATGYALGFSVIKLTGANNTVKNTKLEKCPKIGIGIYNGGSNVISNYVDSEIPESVGFPAGFATFQCCIYIGNLTDNKSMVSIKDNYIFNAISGILQAPITDGVVDRAIIQGNFFYNCYDHGIYGAAQRGTVLSVLGNSFVNCDRSVDIKGNNTVIIGNSVNYEASVTGVRTYCGISVRDSSKSLIMGNYVRGVANGTPIVAVFNLNPLPLNENNISNNTIVCTEGVNGYAVRIRDFEDQEVSGNIIQNNQIEISKTVDLEGAVLISGTASATVQEHNRISGNNINVFFDDVRSKAVYSVLEKCIVENNSIFLSGTATTTKTVDGVMVVDNSIVKGNIIRGVDSSGTNFTIRPINVQSTDNCVVSFNDIFLENTVFTVSQFIRTNLSTNTALFANKTNDDTFLDITDSWNFIERVTASNRSSVPKELVRRDELVLTYPNPISDTGILNNVALSDDTGALHFSAAITEITGIVSNTDNKKINIWTENASGLILSGENASSTAANRFHYDIFVPYRRWVTIHYNDVGGLDRWTLVGKEAAASADTATAVGATYSQAEVQAILDELRDLKTKMRTAGLLAT